MDARIYSALHRFVRGEIELFGKPESDDAENPDLRVEEPYTFSRFCVYLAVHRFNLAVHAFDDAVTEGKGERGFDGIAVSLGDLALDTPEAATQAAREAIATAQEATESGEPLVLPPVRVLMVQVKRSTMAEMAELDYLANSTFRFLTMDEAEFSAIQPNEMVERWWRIHHNLRTVFTEHGLPFSPELDLVFIYQGFRHEDNALNNAARLSAVKILRSLLGHDRANFTIWGGDEIVDAIALADQSIDGVLQDASLLPLPEAEATGYIGYASADAITDLIPLVYGRPDERVFSDNVRSFTGDNDYNLGAMGLQRSLTEGEANQVILRHNGITIVARGAKLLECESGGFDVELKDFQIVNGAQTSFVLHKNKELLAGAHIPVKIVLTEDDAVKDGVVLGANTQSQVRQHDMLARVTEVRALQQGFETIHWKRRDRLWLMRRKGERFANKIYDGAQIVTPRQLLETYVAAIEASPHAVHSNSGKLLKKIPDSVFRRDHHLSVYRAMGWLVAAGRRWAREQKLSWPEADDSRKKNAYAARHQFVFALWRLADPNPDAVFAEQGHLSHRSAEVQARFEALCKLLSQRKPSLELANRAAHLVEEAKMDDRPLSAQVRLKEFTLRVKKAADAARSA